MNRIIFFGIVLTKEYLHLIIIKNMYYYNFCMCGYKNISNINCYRDELNPSNGILKDYFCT